MRRYFEYGRRVLEALKEEETTKHEIASQYPQADDPSINDVPEPDDMQHVGALAEEINGPWECEMSAKIDENRAEDDAIIDLIEKVLQNTAFYGKIPVYVNHTGKQRNFFTGGSL